MVDFFAKNAGLMSSLRNEYSIKFIVDGMLGSLARKLRLYGFDTLYIRDAEDNELLNEANLQKRILLTSDRKLAEMAYARGVAVILLEGKNDVKRMAEVSRLLNIKLVLDSSNSRCAVCNGELSPASKKEISEEGLDEKILARYDEFFRCMNCGKVYWVGGHWKKLVSFQKELEMEMKSNDRQ